MAETKKKREVGLPAGFGISIAVDRPVDLGGYLDEVLEPTKPEKTTHAAGKQSGAQEGSEPEATATKTLRTEPPRKQMNMKPETMRKVEELLNLVRNRGPQRTTAMSEVFDAMIGILYESRDSIDFAGVPKRGRWGSATASAYVTALGKAFADAICQRNR